MLNWLAGYLTERQIPDLTSGFRAARREYLLEFIHLLPNGFSTPTTTTLAFIKAGYNVAFEPVAARAARRHVEDQARAATAPSFCLILLKVITIFSPLRIFVPDQRGVVRAWRGVRRVELHLSRAHPQRRGAAADVLGPDLAGRTGVGTDLDAAFRGASLATRDRRSSSSRPTTNGTTCRSSSRS